MGISQAFPAHRARAGGLRESAIPAGRGPLFPSVFSSEGMPPYGCSGKMKRLF